MAQGQTWRRPQSDPPPHLLERDRDVSASDEGREGARAAVGCQERWCKVSRRRSPQHGGRVRRVVCVDEAVRMRQAERRKARVVERGR